MQFHLKFKKIRLGAKTVKHIRWEDCGDVGRVARNPDEPDVRVPLSAGSFGKDVLTGLMPRGSLRKVGSGIASLHLTSKSAQRECFFHSVLSLYHLLKALYSGTILVKRTLYHTAIALYRIIMTL